MHPCLFYTSHLALFNEQFVEPQEITLEVTEKLPKLV